MSFIDSGNGLSAADVAAVVGGNNGMDMAGGNGLWWLIVFLVLIFNGGWGNGIGNGGNNNPAYPYPAVQQGFDQAAIMGAVDGVRGSVTSGFGDTALGIAGINQNISQVGNSITSAITSSQMNTMQLMFSLQQALSDCCCENRLGVANLGADIARESCATRQTVNELGMNITAQNTANTNAIITAMNAGFNDIQKQNYLDKIDAKNDEIAQLRQEVLFARGQASQISQNEQIVNSIYNRLDTCPVGTTPVYGRTPIFNCNNNGCGCGVA